MPRRAPLNSNVLAPRMLSYVPLVSVLNTTILEESRTFSRFVSPVAEACTTILKAECPTCTVILVVDWYRRYPLLPTATLIYHAKGTPRSSAGSDPRRTAASRPLSPATTDSRLRLCIFPSNALDSCWVLRYRGCIFANV
jgi:hypothetical protein